MSMVLNKRVLFFMLMLSSTYTVTVEASNHTAPVKAAQDKDYLKQQLINKLTSSFIKIQTQAPSPLAHIHTEGTLPHHGIYDESVAAKHDLNYMYLAALLWSAQDNKAALRFATTYLMTWIKTYQPSLNPIDETGFDQMIYTYQLISNQLSDTQQETAQHYFSDWAWRYIHDINTHTNHKKTWSNNWQSHRVKLITLMAVALQDKNLFAQAKKLYQAQITQNINADGQTIDYQQRNAIHYVVYDLQPLAQAALAAQSQGEDWLHWQAPNQASLAKAIDWLTPYATGQIAHEEFTHTTVKFDILRQQAHIRGFTGLFDPKDAGTLYWYLSQLDARYLTTAKSIMPTPPNFMVIATPSHQ